MSRGSPSRAFQFPVYQIDFSAVASGKRLAATKRRIRWRFGFPNRAALDEGRTGTDCRGEEHEVVIVWSVTSGKRQIIMDGKEIHYSSTRTSIIDHSWSTKGNHVLKVQCHAAPPMSANPGFRQYDLFIDGQSFFAMPKVYELGLKGKIPGHDRVPGRNDYADHGGYAERTNYGSSPPRIGHAPSDGSRSFASSNAGGGGIRAPRTRDEEDAELQRAISASIEEARNHLQKSSAAPPPPAGSGPGSVVSAPSGGSAGAGGGGDLLDFGGDPLNAPNSSDSQSLVSYNTAPTQLPPGPPAPTGAQGPPTPTAYPPQTQSYGAPPPATTPSFPALPAPAGYPAQGPPSGSFGSPPPPAAPQQASPQAYAPAPAVTPVYAAPPPADANFLAPPPAPIGSASSSDPLAGHSPDDPFAPKPPSHNDIASEILSAYGSSASTPVAGAAPGGFNATPVQQPAPGQPLTLENGQHHQNGTPAPSMSMNGLVETVDESKPENEFDAALKKLVNIDRIDEPAEEQVKLAKWKHEEEQARQLKGKSKGLPPAAHNIVGSQATLSQIQEVKPATSPRENVMNAPPQLFDPNAAAAGAMVVYGTDGPPPLQAQGFGAGYAPQPMYQQQQYHQQMAPPQQYQYQQPPPQQYPPPLQPQGFGAGAYQYR